MQAARWKVEEVSMEEARLKVEEARWKVEEVSMEEAILKVEDRVDLM